MFNFFDEIKSSAKHNSFCSDFNVVNMSGRIIYVEGHKGLNILSKEKIVLLVKSGSISIDGEQLVLQELYDDCVKIIGKIKKIEVFDAKN